MDTVDFVLMHRKNFVAHRVALQVSPALLCFSRTTNKMLCSAVIHGRPSCATENYFASTLHSARLCDPRFVLSPSRNLERCEFSVQRSTYSTTFSHTPLANPPLFSFAGCSLPPAFLSFVQGTRIIEASSKLLLVSALLPYSPQKCFM